MKRPSFSCIRPTSSRLEDCRGGLGRLARILLAVLTLIWSTSVSADTGEGAISGVVYDRDSGRPIPGVRIVFFWYSDGAQVGGVTLTDAQGRYREPLYAGTYRVDAKPDNPAIEHLRYPDISCPDGWVSCRTREPTPTTAGTPVTVLEGRDTSGIDFRLRTTSTGPKILHTYKPFRLSTTATEGSSWLIEAAVSPGWKPLSLGMSVTADLSRLGRSTQQRLYDDGTHGDRVAGDAVFTFVTSLLRDSLPQPVALCVKARDSQLRESKDCENVTVTPGADTDGDGLSDVWEAHFGLDPLHPSGDEDADGDGRTNWHEWQVGTHPLGTFRTYFAEGATSDFFDTRFAVLNPGPSPAHVVFVLQTADGSDKRACACGFDKSWHAGRQRCATPRGVLNSCGVGRTDCRGSHDAVAPLVDYGERLRCPR